MSNHFRVLHITKESPVRSFGGTETVLQQFLKGEQFVNYSFTVFCCAKKSNRESFGRHEVVCFRSALKFCSTPLSLGLLIAIARQARDFDLIHWHAPFPGVDLLAMLGLIDKKRIIVTYHSDIVVYPLVFSIYRWIYLAVLKRVGKVVATSQNYRNSSPILRKIPDYKISTIHLGLDDELSTNACKAFKYDAIFVGADRHYKGIEVLLSAFSGTDMRLAIVGEVEDSAYRLQSGENVLFLGVVDDNKKCELISQAKCLVLPSINRAEAFGLVLVEGLRSGVPLISTELNTGTSFINVDGETGFVVPPLDAMAIRDAALKLIGDLELRSKLGLAARKRYESLFRSELSNRAYAELYDSMLSEDGLNS